VTYLRWNNGSCAGPAVDTQTVTLDGAGNVPDGQATAPLKAGHYSFRADYSGDPSLQASTGACEPFAVLARGRFRVFHVHVHHDGVVSFDATVPGAGYVGVLETAWKKTEAAHPAAVVQRPKPGRFAFARAHLHPTAPGTLHVTVNPNDRGQKLIADHHGRVFIRLWVIYVPPAGGGLKRHGFVGLFVTK
jgi:hypothetical protein